MTTDLAAYRSFLARKHVRFEGSGFTPDSLNPLLLGWQADVVRWACRLGRAALFQECGTGKTFEQLEWCRQVFRHLNGRCSILLLCPLVVAPQTIAEHAKFGIDCPIRLVEGWGDVGPGINVANYEKLHKLDPKAFVAVCADESSILKSYTGKTKQALIAAFASTPYRLACTATPAPNDRMELGNHADFLGIMRSTEMISRWFVNDTMKAGGYRLRKHAAEDFWRWMASWSVCISKPSDLGDRHSDEGYILPPLNLHQHVVESSAPPGHLFHPGGKVSATKVHQEKRAALDERADVVASLVNPSTDAWAVWCDTDYEADAITSRIPDAVEVRGSHSEKQKVERLQSFSAGTARVIVTKSEIAGFGLNWQHCHNTTWFAGYSFERFYQAIRRLYRFGQRNAVNCHVVMSESEQSIIDVVKRKQAEHAEMQAEMAAMMRDGMLESVYGERRLTVPDPQQRMELPSWVKSRQTA